MQGWACGLEAYFCKSSGHKGTRHSGAKYNAVLRKSGPLIPSESWPLLPLCQAPSRHSLSTKTTKMMLPTRQHSPSFDQLFMITQLISHSHNGLQFYRKHNQGMPTAMLYHHRNRSSLPLDTFMHQISGQQTQEQSPRQASLACRGRQVRTSQYVGVSPSRRWSLHLRSSHLHSICFFTIILFIIAMFLEVKICTHFFFLLRNLSIK